MGDRVAECTSGIDVFPLFVGDATYAVKLDRVATVLRTYATEFEDEQRHAYRAHGDSSADGVVVVASDSETAKERVQELHDADTSLFEVERL
mgnify:CR=1 FL=1